MSISRRSFINLAGSSIQTLSDSLAIAMKIMEMQFIANRQIECFASSTCIVTASKHIFLVPWCSNSRILLFMWRKKKTCVFAFHPFSLPLPFADECQGLDWHTRYKIIQGICEALYYLYERQKEPIYHLDLNPRNILLDENMTPKLAYFGYSKIFGKDYLADIWDRDPETL